MRRASRLDLAREASQAGLDADSEPQGQVLESTRKPPRVTLARASEGKAVDRRSLDPWMGRLVDKRYRVTEVLGRGGMGVVYKVEHQRMGKIAAMKVLHSELAKDAEVVRRFQREAEAVSRLAHPNTVQVFDFGAERGALYLVMEYVRGLDLGTLIDRDGPMTFLRAAPLLAQICGALEEAHDLGVVHRDLKPENILVTRTHSGQDFVKVLDFGLAKLSEREESTAVTSRGAIVGTPYYMSPEQIRADEAIDARADIYSFGALLYRLLTADNAFNAKNPVGVLTKHLTEPVVPPGRRYPTLELPPAVDDIVLRCMAKKADDRYDSVRELLAEIETVYTTLVSDISDIRQPSTAWLSGGSPSTAATGLANEIDYGIDSELRLRRSDLDAFESRMRRWRVLRMLLVPLLLLGGLAAGGYYFFVRPPTPHESEIEDNSEIARATLIAANSDVRGHLGKRLSPTSPDEDFYALRDEPDPHGEQIVTIEVSGVPNQDLTLSLYDVDGKLMTSADEMPVGGGEAIRRFRMRRPVVIKVGALMPEGEKSLPVENVSDAYVLRATLGDTDSRWEREPNDSRADAAELIVGTPLSGYLDHAGDVDVFRVTGARGAVRMLISGGPDEPFEWRLDEGPWSGNLSADLQVQEGSLISLRRQSTARVKPLASADKAYTIDLTPR